MTTLTDTLKPAATDILREGGLIRAEVDVPGLHPHVHAHGHTVVIDGERAHRATGAYLVHERPGSFHRELRFPPETDMLKVHARLLDGVLTSSAPYGVGRPEPGDRQVEVRPGIWACHPDAAAI